MSDEGSCNKNTCNHGVTPQFALPYGVFETNMDTHSVLGGNMNEGGGGKGLFSINEFANLSRTTKDTLIHYDKIGLLCPLERGRNNYRYYSAEQVTMIKAIRTFKELGMSLNDIKDLMGRRTPDDVYVLLEQQIVMINTRIEEWVRARKLLLTLLNTINSSLNIDEHSITVQFMPAEAIILGCLNDYSRGQNNFDALLHFYHSMEDNHPGLDLNYPVWGIVSEERIKQGDWLLPDRYYFLNPEGYDRRPAALYAIGYIRNRYGNSNELFERLVEYIDRNGFEICGDAYEEYPLDEISIADDNKYLMRIMITVQKKLES